jgi:hypothetical protein
MTIGELKEILSEVPDNMSVEEFDELEFMFTTDGYTYFSPHFEYTGVVDFVDDEDDEETVIFAASPHEDDMLYADIDSNLIFSPN